MQGQEFSAVLPQSSPLDRFLQVRNYQDRRNYMLQQEQMRQQERTDNYLKYAFDKLDFSNFATGTVLDPIVHQTISESLKNISSKLKNGEDADLPSVLYDVTSAASNLSAYTDKAKNIRGQIEQSTKELAKDPSIDPARLKQAALRNAMMTYDPDTHTVRVKSPDELDDQTDWTNYTLQKNPEEAVVGSKSLDQLLKGADKKNYENEFTVNKGGVKRIMGYKGEYFPYNSLLDENGNPVTGATGAVKVGVRSQTLPGGGNIATPEDYAYFTSTPGAGAYLSAAVKKAGIDPTSDQGELAKRAILYDYLSHNNQGYINNVKNTEDASQLQSEGFQRAMKYLGESFKGMQSSQDQKRMANSPITGVIGALAGDQSFMGDAKETDPATGKEYLNLTPYIPGGALYSGKIKKNADGTASKEAYAGIYLDPTTHSLVYKDVNGVKQDQFGMPEKDELGNKKLDYSFTPVPVDKELSLLQQIGEANGLHKNEVTQLYNHALGGKVSDRKAAYDAEQRLQDNAPNPYGWFTKLFKKK